MVLMIFVVGLRVETVTKTVDVEVVSRGTVRVITVIVPVS
jgi:hypothetical protein